MPRYGPINSAHDRSSVRRRVRRRVSRSCATRSAAEAPLVGRSAWPWSMKIVLITPEGPTSRTGNRVSGARWARILRWLGHQVRVASDYDGRAADVMVAVHAWRSAAAIERFKARFPERPLV